MADGVGGTNKRIDAYAILQQPVTGQILSSKSLFEVANFKVPGMQSLWVCTKEIIGNKHLYEKSLNKSSTLSGSRSNYFFRQSSELREILMSPVLSEEAILVNILNLVICDLKVGDYVACTYEFGQCPGLIFDIVIDNDDVL